MLLEEDNVRLGYFGEEDILLRGNCEEVSALWYSFSILMGLIIGGFAYLLMDQVMDMATVPPVKQRVALHNEQSAPDLLLSFPENPNEVSQTETSSETIPQEAVRISQEVSNPKPKKELPKSVPEKKKGKIRDPDRGSIVEEIFPKMSSDLSSRRIIPENRKVRRGETLEGIAREYGLSWKKLCHANQLANCHRIVAGQMLTMPSKDESPKTDSVRVAVHEDRVKGQFSSKKRSAPPVIPNSGKRVNSMKAAAVAERNLNAYPLVRTKRWYAEKELSLTKLQWRKLFAAGLTMKQIDAVDENLRNGLCKGALRHEGYSWTFFASGKGVFRDSSRNVLETDQDVWQCPEAEGVQVDILIRSGNLAGNAVSAEPRFAFTNAPQGERGPR